MKNKSFTASEKSAGCEESPARGARRNGARRNDALLIGAVLVLALALQLFFWLRPRTAATRARITVDGQLYADAPLSAQIFDISQAGSAINRVELYEGGARMQSANCGNQACVRQGDIRESGQAVVCLPHRVVVELYGGEARVDAVAY